MAANKKNRKSPDLAPKSVKTKDAASVRGGSTIGGSQVSVKTNNWNEPPQPDVGQRSRINKV
jgi:hypothetical protein